MEMETGSSNRRKSNVVHYAQRRRNSFVVLRSRLPMKSNPYIGSFRHAPPRLSTRRDYPELRPRLPKKYTLNLTSSSLSSQHLRVPSTISQMKNSPHVGFFRHAPPSRLSISTTTGRRMTSDCTDSHWEQKNLSNILTVLTSRLNEETDKLKKKVAMTRNCDDTKIIILDGRLPGGSPAVSKDGDGHPGSENIMSLPTLFPLGTVLSDTFHHGLRDLSLFLQETSIISSSATISVLCRLAYWFLFPLAHDAGGDYMSSSSKADRSIASGTINIMDLFPYMFPATYKRLFKNRTSSFGGKGKDDININDGDSDSLSSIPSSSVISEISDDLEGSLSSLAEAYHAHQAVQDMFAQEEYQEFHAMATTPSPHGSELQLQDDGGHHLDYMISQMDIARMAKNASRHLDVESILSLPTVTYRAESPPTTPFSQQHQEQQQYERTEEEGWSWMIVPPSNRKSDDIMSNDGHSDNQQHAGVQSFTSSVATPPNSGRDKKNENDDNEDVCVICLEKFVDGDRLRVLPCDHMFHTGCIDRWLSGADDSNFECFTSGCPTCKKRPDSSCHSQGQSQCNEVDSDEEQQGITILEPADGSVPSWAYTRIGETLALSQSCLTSDI